MRRRILFLTATRAEFGKLKPLIARVRDAGAAGFDYQIFATGMHMHARYGSTLIEISKAGFDQVYPYINQDGRSYSPMDQVLANTIHGLGLFVREFPPDLIVLHGDRVEALAGAVVGMLNSIRVAHIEGGEVSGTVDEMLRHAISKLSHIHFVANEEARLRLIQMGEHEETIYVIGSPEVDVMLSDALPSLEEVKKHYAIPFEEYAIFVFHPVTTELNMLNQQIEAIIQALLASNFNFIAIYPNNDNGSEVIIAALERLRENPRFMVLPSMRFEYYLVLLRHALAIVGNSSSGVREAPVYGIPTVNIGSRQNNRFKYESILNVPAERDAILGALRHLPMLPKPTLHFGQGHSADLFMAALNRPQFWEVPIQKQFHDLPSLKELASSRTSNG